MDKTNTALSGQVVDIVGRRIFPGIVLVRDGKVSIIQSDDVPADRYIIPGFIDAHIHIESSMLIPSEFARLAVVHGTVATVSDPHEIANVFGLKGVKLMADEAENQPIHVWVQVPSCVPSAPGLETPGSSIGPEDVAEAMNWDRIIGHWVVFKAGRSHGRARDTQQVGIGVDQAIG